MIAMVDDTWSTHHIFLKEVVQIFVFLIKQGEEDASFEGGEEIRQGDTGNGNALPQHVDVLVFPKGTHLLQGITKWLYIQVIVPDQEIAKGLHVFGGPDLLTVPVVSSIGRTFRTYSYSNEVGHFVSCSEYVVTLDIFCRDTS